MNTIRRAALVLTASVFVNVVLACGSDGLTFGGKGASAAEPRAVFVACDKSLDADASGVGHWYAETTLADGEVATSAAGHLSHAPKDLPPGYESESAVVVIGDGRAAVRCGFGNPATAATDQVGYGLTYDGAVFVIN